MCVSLPGRILEVESERAIVDVGGRKRPVSLALLVLEGSTAGVGDWVLTSAGLAVRRLDEHEARELLETLGGQR